MKILKFCGNIELFFYIGVFFLSFNRCKSIFVLVINGCSYLFIYLKDIECNKYLLSIMVGGRNIKKMEI